jgi:hypothetical protein
VQAERSRQVSETRTASARSWRFKSWTSRKSRGIRIADRGYVIVHGKIAFEGGSADELNNNEPVRKFYLGL